MRKILAYLLVWVQLDQWHPIIQRLVLQLVRLPSLTIFSPRSSRQRHRTWPCPPVVRITSTPGTWTGPWTHSSSLRWRLKQSATWVGTAAVVHHPRVLPPVSSRIRTLRTRGQTSTGSSTTLVRLAVGHRTAHQPVRTVAQTFGRLTYRSEQTIADLTR